MLLSLPFPANFILPSSTTLCFTSSIISSPWTFKFPWTVTFPSLSTVKAFTAAPVPSFVANTIRSFPFTLRLASPTPRATSPSITSAPVVSFPTIKLFPTTNEFVKLLTLLLVP